MSNIDGIVTIRLGSKDFRIKPTWKAIHDIEHALGCGMVHYAVNIVHKRYSLRDIAVLVYHGLLACPDEDCPAKPTLEKVSELVYETGLLNPDLIQSITTFCEYAMTGGRVEQADSAGKPAAAAKP